MLRNLVLAVVGLLVAGSMAMAGPIYFEDFEGAVGAEWSSTGTATTPVGCTTCTTYLGPFVNDSVSLTLNGLPTGTTLTITFDAFYIYSWDGNGEKGWGPDYSTFAISGVDSWTYTFANGTGITQSYPTAGSAPQTGADQVNTLGYTFGGVPRDAVYYMSYSWLNTDSSRTFTWSASGLQGMSGYGYPDEMWGIDNVSVSSEEAVPEPGTALLFGSGILAFLLYRRRRSA